MDNNFIQSIKNIEPNISMADLQSMYDQFMEFHSREIVHHDMLVA